MKNSANNQVSEREAQGSSVQTAHMKIEIPSDIQSPNHRKAYAMAYRAAYDKKHLRFVSEFVRFSIERGFSAMASRRGQSAHSNILRLLG